MLPDKRIPTTKLLRCWQSGKHIWQKLCLLYFCCQSAQLAAVEWYCTYQCCLHKRIEHIGSLVQDCSISNALAMEILQPYTRPSMFGSVEYIQYQGSDLTVIIIPCFQKLCNSLQHLLNIFNDNIILHHFIQNVNGYLFIATNWTKINLG